MTTHAPSCSHCGEPVPAERQQADGGPLFCCGGCERVYHLINDWGLDDFYRLRDSGGVLRPEARTRAAEAGTPHPVFDGPAFAQAFIHQRDDGLCELDWHVTGIHCAACVWLLESLPRLNPGIRSSRVDFAANRLRIVYQSETISPGSQADLIGDLGYRVSAWGDRVAADAARAERRRWLLRFAVSAAAAMSS
ncbi:MAG: heavy metal translocating P-type ATPase metal-binding domain-containing protein, partial [Planctomycetota bacterium]